MPPRRAGRHRRGVPRSLGDGAPRCGACAARRVAGGRARVDRSRLLARRGRLQDRGEDRERSSQARWGRGRPARTGSRVPRSTAAAAASRGRAARRGAAARRRLSADRRSRVARCGRACRDAPGQGGGGAPATGAGHRRSPGRRRAAGARDDLVRGDLRARPGRPRAHALGARAAVRSRAGPGSSTTTTGRAL